MNLKELLERIIAKLREYCILLFVHNKSCVDRLDTFDLCTNNFNST